MRLELNFNYFRIQFITTALKLYLDHNVLGLSKKPREWRNPSWCHLADFSTHESLKSSPPTRQRNTGAHLIKSQQ